MIAKVKKHYNIIAVLLCAIMIGSTLCGCGQDEVTQTPADQTATTQNETDLVDNEDSFDIDCAYMLGGVLYVRGDLTGDFSVVQILDAAGDEVNVEYTDIEADPDTSTVAGFSEFYLYQSTDLADFKGHDKILFADGKYEIKHGDKQWPVVSVANYAQDSGLKTDKGDKLDFCDYYYPIVYNASAYDNISIICNSTTESKDPANWPKILRDGNLETLRDGSEIQITYPKKENSDEPMIFEDIASVSADGKNSLDHMDKLTVMIDGDRTDILFWDQIAKVWFRDTTSKYDIDMVYVDGGSYKAGDWRDENSSEHRYTIAYVEGKTTQNILKMWNNVLDPQYMGEEVVGNEAVGVTGLMEKDSQAFDVNCPMWKLNDASEDVHNVTVSDYWLGKYEITMEQFYTFVNECQVKSKDPIVVSYKLGDVEYVLDDVSAYQIMFKKETAKDNGWGLGARPAIDISWYEAVQFCNFYSIKSGYDPCYSFVNIYNGKEGDGKTECTFLSEIAGSDMQKGDKKTADLQLVKVVCDFDKNGFRLPTEAEYEYAARGGKYIDDVNNGNGSLFSGLSTSTTVEEPEDYTDGFHDLIGYYAWVNVTTDNPKKNGEYTSSLNMEGAGGNAYSGPVGSKLSNPLGIYDLVGNVWEQQWDYYNRSYYSDLAKNSDNKDPRGPQYTDEQLSVFNDFPVDPSMQNEFMYSYKREEEGNGQTRAAVVSIKNSGKVAHTLRGGSFSNPIGLANTVNRFGPSQAFSMNYMNFTDARIGFRVARSVTADEKAGRITDTVKEKELCAYGDSFLYRVHAPVIREQNMDMVVSMIKDGAQITYNGTSMSFDEFFKNTSVPEAAAISLGNHIVRKKADGSYVVSIMEYVYDKDDQARSGSTVVRNMITIEEKDDGQYQVSDVTCKTYSKNMQMPGEKEKSEGE